MAKYKVKTQGTYTQYIIVEASDKTEAIDKALNGEGYEDGDLEISPLFRDIDEEEDVYELQDE